LHKIQLQVLCEVTKPYHGWLGDIKVQAADSLPQTLLDQDEFEETLLKYGCTHFDKAEDSPFILEQF